MSNRTWIRILYIRLAQWDSSEWHEYGHTTDDSKKPKIEISGGKYLSCLKDNFTIKIYNLPMPEILKIMMGEWFHVQIFAGYLGTQNRDTAQGKLLFDGGVISISNNLVDYKDNVLSMICGSRFMAKAMQWRCNVNFSSGVNMYNAIKYIAHKAGLTNISVSDSFKSEFYTQIANAKSTAGNFFDTLASGNESFFDNVDSTDGAQISFFDALKYENRQVIEIDISKGMMIGGVPSVTSNGVTWTSLPVYNYKCGDLVHLDNAYINTGGNESYSSVTSSVPNAFYLDTEGLYYVYELTYNLDNTTGSFQVNILAKAKSLFKKVYSSGS